MDISQQKKVIRKEIKQLKQSYPKEKLLKETKKIWKKIEELDVFKNSETIMLYWSMADEVSTHDFVQKWAASKRILLPSVNGDELELKYFKRIGDMNEGQRYGIPEPIGEVLPFSTPIDLIIIPGVAFDTKNNRLGRGKAYYDKFLRNRTAIKIGVCYGFQFLETIPTENTDIKMDMVITA